MMTAPEPAKPFDTAMKVLWELNPGDYAAWLTGTRSPAETIDADLATVSGAADKVIRVGRGKKRSLLAVEFQASYKPDLPERTHWHSALLEHRHDLPVQSVILLLRPEADGPAMSGTFERHLPGDAEPYRTFRYRVVRLWEMPPDMFLAGGPGFAALATIADVPRDDLPDVIHRARQRIRETTPAGKLEDVLATAALLMGARYDKEIAALMREVREMEESSVYQEIVRIGEARGEVRGEVRGIRDTILRQGRIKFGKAGRNVVARLNRIEDLDRLHALADRLIRAENWDDLLAGE
jgi:predicted transposase YdaD